MLVWLLNVDFVCLLKKWFGCFNGLLPPFQAKTY